MISNMNVFCFALLLVEDTFTIAVLQNRKLNFTSTTKASQRCFLCQRDLFEEVFLGKSLRFDTYIPTTNLNS